jgi:hypothetical protein
LSRVVVVKGILFGVLTVGVIYRRRVLLAACDQRGDNLGTYSRLSTTKVSSRWARNSVAPCTWVSAQASPALTWQMEMRLPLKLCRGPLRSEFSPVCMSRPFSTVLAIFIDLVWKRCNAQARSLPTSGSRRISGKVSAIFRCFLTSHNTNAETAKAVVNAI